MPVLLSTVLGALSLSILSTRLADHFLAARISLAGSVIGFERIMNDGIALGIDLPSSLMMILIPAVTVFVCFLAFRSRHDRWTSFSFGLIIGGALGNIVDRLNDGHVTDFIQIGWWPLFNIADSCITVGVLLLLLQELKTKKKEQQ